MFPFDVLLIQTDRLISLNRIPAPLSALKRINFRIYYDLAFLRREQIGFPGFILVFRYRAIVWFVMNLLCWIRGRPSMETICIYNVHIMKLYNEQNVDKVAL